MLEHFEHFGKLLENEGYPDAAAAVRLLEADLERAGLLPPSVDGEGIASSESENPISFTEQARKELEDRGFCIVKLTGNSIAQFRASNPKDTTLYNIWSSFFPVFEGISSRGTEIAFDPSPDRFFIPNSGNSTFYEQLALIEEYSDGLGIDGTRAIMGEAADYVDLAFTYRNNTGEFLFGPKYDNRLARTQTSLFYDKIIVGHFDPKAGLRIGRWVPERIEGLDHVFAVPLIVPSVTSVPAKIAA